MKNFSFFLNNLIFNNKYIFDSRLFEFISILGFETI
jgi:hypothetical protein